MTSYKVTLSTLEKSNEVNTASNRVLKDSTLTEKSFNLSLKFVGELIKDCHVIFSGRLYPCPY